MQIRKRNADWGPQEVNRRFNAAQRRFIDHARDPAKRWLALVEERGFEAAQARIARLAAGSGAPQEGYVVVVG
ncbi:hypothetical protein D3C86_2241280 [compost metagenome]